MDKLRKFFAPRDMTTGTPWKRILMFAVPMLIGNVAQQLYNTVDSAIVGKYVGDHALGAVGSTFPIIMLFLVIIVGIATGVGIRVSQYYGAKDSEKLSKVVGNCITLTFIGTIVTMTLGLLLLDHILQILNTPLEIRGMTKSYLSIFFWGLAGALYYNILGGILRGLGDSLSALLFLLVSTVLNIVLDLWFVVSFQMGVTGVALATLISQSISALLCYIKLRSTKEINMSLKYFKLDKEIVYDVLKLGMPSGITQGVFSLAILLVTRLENSFGASFVTLSSVVRRVDAFAVMPTFTFGQALTTYIGQNVGAKSYDRLKTGARQGTALAAGVTGVLTVLLLLFGKDIMHIFTETTAIIDKGAQVLRILAFGYIGMSVLQCMSGVMRGAGDTVTPMYISIFSSVVLRVSLAYLLVHLSKTPEDPKGNPLMVYYSLLATWTIGAFLNFYFYRKGKWRRKLENIMRE